jgi:soluble P-type ATPase
MKKRSLLLTIVLAHIFLCLLASEHLPPTDTIAWHHYDSMPGFHYLLNYSYNNGQGYFFGTNFLDLDQDPNTPYQDGVTAFAQGFKGDTAGYEITEVLFFVGRKIKNSSFGTPLIVSLQLLDDSSTYTVNTSTGSQTYTIGAPGTLLASTSVHWDEIVETAVAEFEFTIAPLPSPVFVNQDYAVVIDLFDFYMNDDRLGFMTAGNGSASACMGKQYCLWLYPDPLLWLQVSHLYSAIDRAIGVFPVIDDGTSGIEKDAFEQGMKLGYVYPNPNQGKAKVIYELQNAETLNLMIVNQAGQLMEEKQLGLTLPGEHELQLDFQAYSAGVYYLLLQGGKHTISRKVQLIH